MTSPPTIGLLTSVGQTLDAFFIDIIDEWRQLGHAVQAAAGTPASHVEASVLPSITRSPKFRNWRAGRELKAWVKNHRIDVILTNTATASALVRIFDTGAPVVYFCHGLHWNMESITNLPIRFIEALLHKRTAGVLTLNSDDTAWFQARDNSVPLLRLPYGVGVSPSKYPRTPTPYNRIPELLWIGEFTARKNPESALDVARELTKTGLEFRLTMLGDGPLLAETKTKASKYGIQQHVSFPGRSPAEPFITGSDALIHTAQWEGLPRVLLEAVSIGRPTYGYDVKGTRDIPGIRLFPFGDSVALACAIARDIRRGTPHTTASPQPDQLSYRHSARMISAFVQNFARTA